jgi:hypothetical protein
VLELVYEPESQRQAFVEACAWAEHIDFCLAWIEPGDAQGPAFADLEPHQAKLRHAVVGLAHLQSYPALLRRLYRQSSLRLVSSMDGSFSPNMYLFRRGPRVRVLMASAPFTSTRFAKSCEAFVVFEGDRDEPFALRAVELLHRCLELAHMPTKDELDAYDGAWAEARSGGRLVETIPGLALKSSDAARLGELTLIEDTRAVLDAFVRVRDSLSAAAALRLPGSIVARGVLAQAAPLRTTLYWSPLGVWAALHRIGERYGLHFGFASPWEVERHVAVVSLVAKRAPTALSALVAEDDEMGVARADDGRCFLTHFAPTADDYTSDVAVRNPSGTVPAAPATLIGEIGAADFVQTAAAFALRLGRRRATREQAPE